MNATFALKSLKTLPGLPLLAALSLAALFTGCGSGVATTLPSAIPAAKGLPSGPVLGYIFSATDGTLRPMLGVRGSAQLGQSIVPAGVYVAGDASSASSTGLLQDSTGSLYSLALPASQAIHIADNFSGRAQFAFSSNGATAVAYSAGGTKLLVITGLPSAPQVQTIAVPPSLRLVSAAVSNTGTVAAASATTAGTLSNTGVFTRLASLSAVGGINFIPGTDDLLLADQSSNTVSLVRNASTSPALSQLSASGLNQPVAIAASQDKHWAVVANGGDQNVVRLDLSTGSPGTLLACSCQPSQLATLAGGAGFRLNGFDHGPVWTIDISAATPQLLFVPAIQ